MIGGLLGLAQGLAVDNRPAWTVLWECGSTYLAFVF